MGIHFWNRGQVLPLVALCLAGLMGFAGLAIDVSYWEYRQNAQQAATDAAAIGGAQQILYGGTCPNQNSATTAATDDAAGNGFTNGGNVTVTVNNPPSSGPYAGSNCTVSVQITTTKVASFFSGMLGFGNGVSETTQAAATLSAVNGGCIFMLQAGQNTNFHGGNIVAPYCSILLNGSADFNAATVNAAAIGEVNYSGSNNGGTFTQATPVPILSVADPCAEIAGCAYLTSNPPSTSPCNGSYSGNGTLQSGCYNNLNMNGATVTLSGGLYVFAGASNFNMASITGSGVTIYIPAGATTNFNKVDAMNISAPTSGSYSGVAYYQAKANTGAVNFNGSSTSLTGLIYAPTAQMNYNGSGDVYTVLVAAYANLNNSGGNDFASPAPNESPLIFQSTLAQ
jgi:Putative Flp pilus-assembly TadE/G-like